MTRSLFAIGLTLAVAAVATPTAGQIQPPTPRPQPQGTAVIRGRVVAADTGQPLRHATIRVNDPTARVNSVAKSDADGRFEVGGLPAGRYLITATQEGYVPRTYNRLPSGRGASTLNLSDGDVVESVDLSLARGAVLSGRVVDEAGEAMVGVSVMVLRRAPFSAPRRPGVADPRMAPAGQSTTDDLGEFRIYGLDAGTYYLQAVWRGVNIAGLDDRLGYQPTFFPGAAAVDGATPITVNLAQQLSGLAFAMIPTRVARLSGTAIDVTGAPVESGAIRAIPLDVGGSAPPITAGLRPGGTFSLFPVVAGDYLLTVTTRPGREEQLFATPFTVTGDDVSDVVVAGVRPVHVTGRIVVDPAATSSAPASRLAITVNPESLQVVVAAMGRRPNPAAVAPDLTFDVEAWPVPSNLAFQRLPPGWALKAVRHRGVDITDERLDLKRGEDLDGFEVELTDRLTHLTGRAATSSGAANVAGTLLVFPRDARLRSVARRTKMMPIRGESEFSVEGLPPGDYYAVAIETGDQPPASFANAFDRWEPVAIAVSLAEGETRTLDLTLMPPF